MEQLTSELTAEELAARLELFKEYSEEPLRRSAGDSGYKLVPMNAAEMESHSKWVLELDARSNKLRSKLPVMT